MPAPRTVRGLLSNPVPRGILGGSVRKTDRAGASGDQAPIELLKDFAKRLEGVSKAIAQQTTALKDRREDSVDQALLDEAQTNRLEVFNIHLDAARDSFKEEGETLSQVFEKGFKDLDAELDENFEVYQEQTTSLLRLIEEQKKLITGPAK
ncbi:unnamed protein product [Peniophora sp. CBMAI 1063]|nr:unnamed protein product [Peniophora sp. CBMAI 1063]